MTASEAHYKRAGLIMVALAALCWSSGGLFVRAIETDLATMLFWRGLFSGAAVMAFFFYLEGQARLCHSAALALAGLRSRRRIGGEHDHRHRGARNTRRSPMRWSSMRRCRL